MEDYERKSLNIKAYPLIYSRTEAMDFTNDFTVRPSDAIAGEIFSRKYEAVGAVSLVDYVRGLIDSSSMNNTILYCLLRISSTFIIGIIGNPHYYGMDQYSLVSGRRNIAFSGLLIETEGRCPEISPIFLWKMYESFMDHIWSEVRDNPVLITKPIDPEFDGDPELVKWVNYIQLANKNKVDFFETISVEVKWNHTIQEQQMTRSGMVIRTIGTFIEANRNKTIRLTSLETYKRHNNYQQRSEEAEQYLFKSDKKSVFKRNDARADIRYSSQEVFRQSLSSCSFIINNLDRTEDRECVPYICQIFGDSFDSPISKMQFNVRHRPSELEYSNRLQLLPIVSMDQLRGMMQSSLSSISPVLLEKTFREYSQIYQLMCFPSQQYGDPSDMQILVLYIPLDEIRDGSKLGCIKSDKEHGTERITRYNQLKTDIPQYLYLTISGDC